MERTAKNRELLQSFTDCELMNELKERVAKRGGGGSAHTSFIEANAKGFTK